MYVHRQEATPSRYYKPIKQVTEFIYLGHKLTFSNNHEATLKQNRPRLGCFSEEQHRIKIQTRTYFGKSKYDALQAQS